ncbi:hypothetical protein GCM10023258_26230 [Terrabacter aeriphilus]|uniref:Lipoprotein n=1 Tax=Terrabacter aeriphilus TaxID=515662 RepID=A0ABP9JEQ5_9MICO
MTAARPARRIATTVCGVAPVTLVMVLGACTAGGAVSPGPALDAPSFTTIPERVTVTVDRLEPPAPTDDEVARLEVNDADGDRYSGSSSTTGATSARADARYRLLGRCLRDQVGGRLVVSVLGPPRPGSTAGAPSNPLSGKRVATFTVPCDGDEARLDLPRLPARSGELTVSPATRSVSVGWVVLTRAR